MKQTRPHSKYNRIYGMTGQQLARKLHCCVSMITYLHHKGWIEHLKIENAKQLESVDKRILKLLNNINYYCFKSRGVENYLTLNDILCVWNRDSAEAMERPILRRRPNMLDYSIKTCYFFDQDKHNKSDIISDL